MTPNNWAVVSFLCMVSEEENVLLIINCVQKVLLNIVLKKNIADMFVGFNPKKADKNLLTCCQREQVFILSVEVKGQCRLEITKFTNKLNSAAGST